MVLSTSDFVKDQFISFKTLFPINYFQHTIKNDKRKEIRKLKLVI